ncbi:MAG: hypothetical protein HOH48_07070 [Candidatus Puniceispirillum sp.]|jgi:hypothetical protein|uniref:hypothetical protein n=1 Tax=Candidatus Puniceispirillum sp. TaxID=2026719 RepID=UPI001ED4C860|nr:hypothetical protein [Candidatus Puniceispirillum sp.]MBT6414558.1 hypothetical protein [Candidatus Puniceispirillum sp.]
MDALTFISEQTIYLLSMVLPDANPKQIRLLLLSSVGLAIVLMMFAIMWSMFREKLEPQAKVTPKAKTPAKAKKAPKAKKAGKTAKATPKQAIKADKPVSKKPAAKKVVAKNKAEPKTGSPIEPSVEATDNIPGVDIIAEQAPKPEASVGGFSFFKRESTGAKADAELVSIEQEMLAIRQLYMDERITKDVYVVETRRLYEKASELRSV